MQQLGLDTAAFSSSHRPLYVQSAAGDRCHTVLSRQGDWAEADQGRARGW